MRCSLVYWSAEGSVVLAAEKFVQRRDGRRHLPTDRHHVGDLEA
jgi:hypothetical protein